MSTTIGSVADIILQQIGNVSDGVSGTMLSIVRNELFNISNFTGNSYSEDAIPDEVSPALFDLSKSDVLGLVSADNGNASDIKLGDFTVKKGGSSGDKAASDSLRESGIDKMYRLGAKFVHMKTF